MIRDIEVFKNPFEFYWPSDFAQLIPGNPPDVLRDKRTPRSAYDRA